MILEIVIFPGWKYTACVMRLPALCRSTVDGFGTLLIWQKNKQQTKWKSYKDKSMTYITIVGDACAFPCGFFFSIRVQNFLSSDVLSSFQMGTFCRKLFSEHREQYIIKICPLCCMFQNGLYFRLGHWTVGFPGIRRNIFKGFSPYYFTYLEVWFNGC